MIDNKKVGLAIAQLRQSKNLTQQQLRRTRSAAFPTLFTLQAPLASKEPK